MKDRDDEMVWVRLEHPERDGGPCALEAPRRHLLAVIVLIGRALGHGEMFNDDEWGLPVEEVMAAGDAAERAIFQVLRNHMSPSEVMAVQQRLDAAAEGDFVTVWMSPPPSGSLQ